MQNIIRIHTIYNFENSDVKNTRNVSYRHVLTKYVLYVLSPDVALRSLTLLAPSIPDVGLIVLGRNSFVALPASLGDLSARYGEIRLCDRHRVIRPGAPGGAWH